MSPHAAHSRDRVRHIYNGVSLLDIERYQAKKNFKQKQGIEGKFLVSYVGILSPFQGLDSLLDVAKTFCEFPDIIFYIVGEGMERSRLESRIENEHLDNVRLLPLQPREEYFNIISSSDLSIVSLDNRMKAPCIPGKIINLMATGQPILAIMSPDSEASQLVRKARCGYVMEPANIEVIKQKILELKNNNDLMRELGRNGREYLENHMRIEFVSAQYEKIFEDLVSNPGIHRHETPRQGPLDASDKKLSLMSNEDPPRNKCICTSMADRWCYSGRV